MVARQPDGGAVRHRDPAVPASTVLVRPAIDADELDVSGGVAEDLQMRSVCAVSSEGGGDEQQEAEEGGCADQPNHPLITSSDRYPTICVPFGAIHVGYADMLSAAHSGFLFAYPSMPYPSYSMVRFS